MNQTPEINPKLDLLLDRTIPVPRELVWKVWTEPQHLMQWFCPRPWKVSHCEMEVKPGGIFHTTMQSPEGQEFPSTGCFLEAIPCERLAFTSVLLPGFRPAPVEGLQFSVVLTLTTIDGGTRYRAHVLHPDEASREQHEAMGFHHGWNAALDQLIEFAQSLGAA
ncbi:SRPBCC family protein [Tuwongella immobilis]|uniref:Activator of Hsp90 ATPase homologue 1/2-like C-terminal domain-containing protein n=1 Tax=Tuwongella immobilis TaxID=692036 RepID=A0A6C2YR29_9BACT|nr:SRPBCC family protein [Tuwongella immobilis]VIP03332.1 activator of hsp90 atpase : Uncharacterized protein OS=Blastopirellula marina DSM 3645 GN=DSM3645_07875 PE=4 SV=1: AHSA1 [Tuwongella immobilis]VTS04036.1 activator of hsp90 atpase : Uncharacterized protein OS=Blastopirellula marina DSM 3645 GN=DSM3645_07875 PE=4 SV=1: AHSA1 [Tuwongella immobilis]